MTIHLQDEKRPLKANKAFGKEDKVKYVDTKVRRPAWIQILTGYKVNDQGIVF